LQKVHTKKGLDDGAYNSLLIFNASDYDSMHSACNSKRQAHVHDLMNHGNDEPHNAFYVVDLFDIYTSVDTIQALASKFAPRPGMSDQILMPVDK
jgi:hypothetical protein